MKKQLEFPETKPVGCGGELNVRFYDVKKNEPNMLLKIKDDVTKNSQLTQQITENK